MTDVWPPMSSAEAFSAWATAATAAIGAGALAFAWKQLSGAREMHQESDAQESYREFLAMAVAHPELASPDWASIKGTTLEEKYHWFVAYMLAAFEKILLAKRGDEGWRRSVVTSLRRHADYLRDENFHDAQLKGYEFELRRLTFKKVGRCLASDEAAFRDTTPEMKRMVRT